MIKSKIPLSPHSPQTTCCRPHKPVGEILNHEKNSTTVCILLSSLTNYVLSRTVIWKTVQTRNSIPLPLLLTCNISAHLRDTSLEVAWWEMLSRHHMEG